MMNLEKELVFCAIEEDNLQRAYFRVRPLLTARSAVAEEAAALWPDEGCLRIVPDRNEQHTFKERMRTLGGYCVMNLVGVPAEANKIRTNKNYRPDKGEVNQYILYSDTVQALPEHTFFHVVKGAPADFAALAEESVTPLYYILDGETLYGPVHKHAPQAPQTAAAGEGTLFPVDCPDGVQRLIFCSTAVEPTPVAKLAPPPAKEKAHAADKPAAGKEPAPEKTDDKKAPSAPAAAEEPSAAVPEEPLVEPAVPHTEAEEALPIGKPLQILDQSKSFDETIHGLDQPLSKGANLLSGGAPAGHSFQQPRETRALSGTPLFHAPMRTSTPQHKNKLQEVVASQWRVVRNDPPAAPLPHGATMHHVENPVQTACERMANAWQMTESRPQLVDFLLSLDGMQTHIEPRITRTEGETSLQRVLKERLEDLEAERLTALVQLDQAKAMAEDYRRQVLESAKRKLAAESRELSDKRCALQEQSDVLTKQIAVLTAGKEELERRVAALREDHAAALAKALADAQLTAPTDEAALRLAPVTGERPDAEALIARMQKALSTDGRSAGRNAAVALLALLAVCPRIGVASPTTAALSTLAGNVARSMGWQTSYAHQTVQEQRLSVCTAPADATPCVLMTSLPAYAPAEGLTKLFMGRSASWLTRNAAYEASCWPIVNVGALPFVEETEACGEPVSAAALASLECGVHVSADQLRAVLAPIMAKLDPLSGAAWKDLVRFVNVCEPLMTGSLASACDWAIALWLVPAAEKAQRVAAVRPLLNEYPFALSRLG